MQSKYLKSRENQIQQQVKPQFKKCKCKDVLVVDFDKAASDIINEAVYSIDHTGADIANSIDQGI